MAENLGLVSLLPPALTIALALLTRRVLPSLFLGILAGHAILTFPRIDRAPFATIDQMLGVATDRDTMIILAFSLAVGGLLALIRSGRGFEAFANAVERARRGFGKRTAFGVTGLVGAGMFLDVWSNVLVNGATSGPLYDRLGLARARLAYLAHTIAICVVAMAVINSWGAFYIGLLGAQGVSQPFSFVVGSVPFMLYGWLGLATAVLVMATGLSLGPMRAFDAAAMQQRDWAGQAVETADEAPDAAGKREGEGEVEPHLVYMLVPLATMLATVFVALYVTGNGDILAGNGGLSILYAVLLASVVAAALLLWHRAHRAIEVETRFIKGMGGFFDVGLLIVLALTLGELTRMLGTGTYVAGFAAATLPSFVMPALIFLVGTVISFATGTSYGTFAIMTPVALPIAAAYGINPMLMFGAVISGGLFGDNASPISDTTIMTAIGAEIPAIDHFRTQLPYALITAGATFVGFLGLGALI